MFTVRARNVEEALWSGITLLQDLGVKTTSRAGVTLEAPEPVTTTYDNPLERVLFNSVRDANPFFHLMESLWILAGREDVNFLTIFNRRMVEFSDDGKVFHAPYGYRIRQNFQKDQFVEVIRLLKLHPDTRRAVLQIWNTNQDLGVSSVDIPCNDIVFFKIREGKLNMTVCNRSNDLIWGAYGANAVQFSFIQEYIAAMVGVEVGVYNQMSDSFHAYIDNPQWAKLVDWSNGYCYGASVPTPYGSTVEPYPLVTNPDTFDGDLLRWFRNCNTIGGWDNCFFDDVAVPMYRCWFSHKLDKKGLLYVDDIKATDWRLACRNWLLRREG